MTRAEILKELDGLYGDYEAVMRGGDMVARGMGGECAAELAAVLMDEIVLYEGWLGGDDEVGDDDGMDYEGICSVQGLSRFA